MHHMIGEVAHRPTCSWPVLATARLAAFWHFKDFQGLQMLNQYAQDIDLAAAAGIPEKVIAKHGGCLPGRVSRRGTPGCSEHS